MQRSRSRLSLVVALAALLASCAGADVGNRPPPERPEVALTPTLVRKVTTDASDVLRFPPAPSGRRQRGELNKRFRPVGEGPLEVSYPSLDDKRHFALHGKSIAIGFNQPVAGATSGSAAGALVRIEPSVTGLARWEDERTLSFTADHYLDPKQAYTLELGEVKSVTGKALASWRASFNTTVGAMVAGKGIGHIPEPGKPRVVALSQGDSTTVSTRPSFRVLFDQPIHIAKARALVSLQDPGDQPVALSFSNAPSDSWSGVKVSRRYVVVVSPKVPLPHGTDYTLVASDAPEAEAPKRHTAQVSTATPLAFQEATCGWWQRDDELCERHGDRVFTSRREIHLRFNNQLAGSDKKLKAQLQITPAVRNLSVSNAGWDDGRVVITGDFRPSTRYRVVAGGLRDVFGQRQSTPLSLEVEIAPLGASISMPEGLVFLDQASTKTWKVSSRNVAEAEIRLWKVKHGDERAFREALAKVRAGQLPSGPPLTKIPFKVAAHRDGLVTTKVDLSKQLRRGASFIATVVPTRFAFAAAPLALPSDSEAAHPPVALLEPGHDKSLAVHVHSGRGETVVQVARLKSGEPVEGARVSVGAASATSDKLGVATLAVDSRDDAQALVKVKADGDEVLVPLSGSVGADGLFPALVDGQIATKRRGMVITDRGIYRPGASVGIKASLYAPEERGLAPVARRPIRVKVVGPSDDAVCDRTLMTSEVGSAAMQCAIPKSARLGLHRIVLLDGDETVAKALVRVGAFEPPRFKVDVDAESAPGRAMRAKVAARYLFGAPMGAAEVSWTLRREEAELPKGPFTAAGMRFRPEQPWWEDDADNGWTKTGEAMLDAKGQLELNQALALDGVVGPQRFVIEADVTDSSARHVAGRGQLLIHPASQYAGVRGPSGWVATAKPFDVELGVIDQAGQPVAGADVTARLEHLRWRYVTKRGVAGAPSDEWRFDAREVASCRLKSAATPVRCALSAPQSGDYRVVAEVGGRRGGELDLWAWRDGDDEPLERPTRGNTLQLVADRASYAPGQTANILVPNPFGEAVVLLSLDGGETTRTLSKRVKGGAAHFSVKVSASNAPRLHATATVIPIGAKGEDIASYRVGALRLPVSMDAMRLAVSVKSDKPNYRPGARAEIQVEVLDADGKPARSELALAVVDEGVLRLTDFHAADPLSALRPAQPLDWRMRDTRSELGQLFEQSHVAGDGGGDELGSMQHTRRRFVQTALWKPQLPTDDAGRAEVSFELPDNLTEFRIMAVALDGSGRGGRQETSFTVSKPVLVQPVLPRFAHVGDELEIAAMVHNVSEQPFAGSLLIDGETLPLSLPAGSREKIGVRRKMNGPGSRTLDFELKDERGGRQDAVQRKLPVRYAGVTVQPSLAGAFLGDATVELAIEKDALISDDADLVIQAGEHLWPELGARMEYLLDYPHGCVEQTTSSTLPLIAARTILPRLGIDRYSDEFFDKRIRAGLERLESMRTPSGGLGYWPGANSPHPYGTAYAMRAVVAAKAAGIEPPAGLLEGMQAYLVREVLAEHGDIGLRANAAQSLSEVDALPPGILETLVERQRELDLFSQASLALAVGELDGKSKRLESLLDAVAAQFDGDGKMVTNGAVSYWGSFHSDQRSMAQAATALSRWRKGSPLLVKLVNQLAEVQERYTTQSVAFGLMAVAEHLRALPDTGAGVEVLIDGQRLPVAKRLAAGAVEVRVPLDELRGAKRKLTLRSKSKAGVGYRVSARYALPTASKGAGQRVRTSADEGPDVFRVFSDAEGNPVDLKAIKTGDLLRVALLVQFDDWEHRYLAVSDRLPAGFEPVDPELSTVASVPEMSEQHPFASLLRWGGSEPSHVEMHDERVHIYFDEVNGQEAVASYLVRATTPGTFALPPASAELMYEANSDAYSEAAEVRIQ